jgi:thiamine-phosphate pyrophosphorylase
MPQLSGLYAITDTTLLPGDKLLSGVADAIVGGARLIQYRDKGSDQPRRLREATQLLQLCRDHGVALIINDDVALAAEIGADGVHLGRDDTDIRLARQRLGRAAIIGVSCYNDWQRTMAARRNGADYIAFGAFFASATKPQAVSADIALLQRSNRELGIAVTAIGGITPENGAALVAAGADMLAVVQGVFAQPDIRRAAEEYARLFKSSEKMKDAT